MGAPNAPGQAKGPTEGRLHLGATLFSASAMHTLAWAVGGGGRRAGDVETGSGHRGRPRMVERAGRCSTPAPPVQVVLSALQLIDQVQGAAHRDARRADVIECQNLVLIGHEGGADGGGRP